jgi:hypothetical protein
MIEWINKIFGIENEVSVPLVVSVIIFIVGGIFQILYKSIANYFTRRKIRQTFYTLLNKTKQDIFLKEKFIFKFYPKFSIQHKGNWLLDHKILGYLPNILALDFQEVYFSFRKEWTIFFWKYKKKDEAFHLIWQCINNLNFIENRIETELINFQDSFNGFHQNYNNALSEFRTFFDDSNFKHNGIKRTLETQKIFDYLVERQEIWQKWVDLGEPDRIGYYSTYNYLVLPNFELNKKHAGLELVKISDSILVDCLHFYVEMENCLNTYNSKFYGLYFQYRICRRRINICIKKLKKCF